MPNEERELIAQVRVFIEKHSLSHFPMFNAIPSHYTGSFYGFRRKTSDGHIIWFISTEIFKQLVCKGFNLRIATRILKEKRLMTTSGEKRNSIPIRVPGIGLGRYYPIDSRILEL